jgi:hypothetical protein
MAVPGITEIKARSIRDFLAQFPFVPSDPPQRAPKPAETPAPAPAAKKSAGKTAPMLVQWEAGPTPPPSDAVPPVTAEAIQLMGKIITLLLSVHAPQFRPRLLRELARFALLVEALATEPFRLSERDRERASRRMRRAGDDFAALWIQDDLDRKTQARFADTLAETYEKLAGLGKSADEQTSGGPADA